MQDITRHEKTWENMKKHEKTWKDITRHRMLRQDKTRKRKGVRKEEGLSTHLLYFLISFIYNLIPPYAFPVQFYFSLLLSLL